MGGKRIRQHKISNYANPLSHLLAIVVSAILVTVDGLHKSILEPIYCLALLKCPLSAFKYLATLISDFATVY